ncbi:hypothetical protein HDC94_001286 [Leifsonia sp. AK011]|uniref:hypothetical protein n=1 Tax=Leifsonia sp. AK011 TaxID=2723075 RepID=UPI0015C92D51|nr:hypothetical protein [Leifsonia sp. AK011]NYF10130.1 hypothetical protein [Leifsonia sp. AK011]
MKRVARSLLFASTAAVLVATVGVGSVAAANLPAEDTMYGLSCPQENNPFVVNAMQLWAIDATTAAGTSVGDGSGDVEGTCAGQPAWNPVTRKAYAFALTDEHDEPSVLMEIDLATGESTPVADMYYEGEPVQVASLAIGLDGAAYALAYTQLYSVDLTTGALKAIGGEIPVSYGFAVDPTTGKFWALAASSSLLEIDVATGGYTFGQSLELPGAYSLQIDSAGGLWVFTANVDDDPILRTELWTASFGATQPSTAVGVVSVAGSGEPFSQALLIVPALPPGGIEPSAPAPALAATGLHPAAGLVVAGVLLLTLGAVLVSRRRPA